MLALLLSVCVMPAAAAGSGSLLIGGASAKQGDTVTLSVKLDSNPDLISMKFTVNYPPDLELISVQNKGVLGGWTTPAPSISSPYTIRWADSLASANSTATGMLVSLTFKVKETAMPGNKTVSINFAESRAVDGSKNSFNSPSTTVKVSCKNHSYGVWAKEDNTDYIRACTACGLTQTAVHTWNGGSVTKQASCKEAGEKTYTCTA